MRVSLSIVLAVTSLLASAGVSGAADQMSVQALLKEGYEIKSTVFVPLAEAKQVYAELDRGIIVVTLQKERSVAACDLNWGNWAALLKSSLENEELCDVRTP